MWRIILIVAGVILVLPYLLSVFNFIFYAMLVAIVSFGVYKWSLNYSKRKLDKAKGEVKHSTNGRRLK